MVAKISAPNQKKERSSATADGREVYIRNIDFRATAADVKAVFEKYGQIEKCHLPPGPKKGMHKGFGFVIFARKEDADRSLEVSGVALKSRILEVSIAQVNPGKKTHIASNAVVAPATPGAAPEEGTEGNGEKEGEKQEGDEATPSFDDIKKKTLGVMNLADTVNDTRLRSMFEPFGPLRKVQLRPDHQGAVVEFMNVADAGRAALALEGTEVDGRGMRIGEVPDLMRQAPQKGVKKGFAPRKVQAAAAPAMVPASVRRGGGNLGGVRGGRRGLGFTGALHKKVDGEAPKENAAKEEGEPKKEGRSNDDFKRMFLQGK